MEFPLYVANHVSPPMLRAHLSVDDTYFRRDTWRRALALNVRVWAAHSTQWTSNRSMRLYSNRFSNGKWVIGLRHIYVYYRIYMYVCVYIYSYVSTLTYILWCLYRWISMIDADFYDILANIGDASILDLYTNCRAIVTERNKVNVESGLLETEKKYLSIVARLQNVIKCINLDLSKDRNFACSANRKKTKKDIRYNDKSFLQLSSFSSHLVKN